MKYNSGSEYSGDENGPPVLKQTNITCTKELTLPDGRRQMKRGRILSRTGGKDIA